VAANCVAQGSSRGVHRIQDFDHRGLLVNIDNLIISVRTTECEGKVHGYFDENCDELTQRASISDGNAYESRIRVQLTSSKKVAVQ